VSANWYKWNLRLGLTAAFLAAASAFFIAGENKLLDNRFFDTASISAASTLLSAVLTSVLTFLAPAEKANAYHDFSKKYLPLRNRIRKFAAIDCLATETSQELEKKFDEILEGKNNIDSDHPIVPEWAYEQARSKLDRKKAAYSPGSRE